MHALTKSATCLLRTGGWGAPKVWAGGSGWKARSLLAAGGKSAAVFSRVSSVAGRRRCPRRRRLAFLRLPSSAALAAATISPAAPAFAQYGALEDKAQSYDAAVKNTDGDPALYMPYAKVVSKGSTSAKAHAHHPLTHSPTHSLTQSITLTCTARTQTQTQTQTQTHTHTCLLYTSPSPRDA